MPTKNFRTRLGLLRSRIMYYWKPFNQRRLRRFYSPLIPAGGLCFDVGAHLGNRIAAFRSLGARVVAVEPQPRCLDYLRQTFGTDTEVQLLPIALGASEGKATLHISQLAPTVSTLAPSEWRETLRKKSQLAIDWEEQLEVEVQTLDQLIERYGRPDFCKIDVEDFEEEVLRGLSQPIPVLSFEFFTWTLPRTLRCLDLLDALGDYEYNWSPGESQTWAEPQWQSPAAIRQRMQKLKHDGSGDVYARLRLQ
ncbi:MAG: FkbM family methyltransferase [Bacteroidota bacterium]